MPGLTAAEYAPIAGLIDIAKAQASAQFRANMLVQVATLRLLIDTKATSVDAAIQQIMDTQKAFAEVFEREDVAIWTQWAIDLLRGEVPFHGSILEQSIQRDERKKRAQHP